MKVKGLHIVGSHSIEHLIQLPVDLTGAHSTVINNLDSNIVDQSRRFMIDGSSVRLIGSNIFIRVTISIVATADNNTNLTRRLLHGRYVGKGVVTGSTYLIG